jgi:hypothetical protein
MNENIRAIEKTIANKSSNRSFILEFIPYLFIFYFFELIKRIRTDLKATK